MEIISRDMFPLVNQKQYTSAPMLLYVCISNGYYRIYVVVIISCKVIQQISVIYFVRTIPPRPARHCSCQHWASVAVTSLGDASLPPCLLARFLASSLPCIAVYSLGRVLASSPSHFLAVLPTRLELPRFIALLTSSTSCLLEFSPPRLLASSTLLLLPSSPSRFLVLLLPPPRRLLRTNVLGAQVATPSATRRPLTFQTTDSSTKAKGTIYT